MKNFAGVTKLELALCGLLLLILIVTGHYIGETRDSDSQKVARRLGPHSASASVDVPHVAPVTHYAEPKLKPSIRFAAQNREDQRGPVQEPNSVEETNAADTGDTTIPVALVDPPDGLLATEEQVAAFDMLRQQFVDSLAPFANDPAAPEYRRRWQQAQELLDDQFATLFGSEAYNQQQNAAVSAGLQMGNQ